MCGISGAISKGNHVVDHGMIEEMNAKIIHRGPDGGGIFLDKNRRVGLGHRRLAIIDLSEDGNQPFFSDSGNLTLVFNGEIYNYKEIREELIRLGYNFKTRTDTEVIIKAYEEWGGSCVNRFNGMWAFALFDRDENQLFLSRDRFGIKPLYYAEIDNYFLFGSEIKQILPFCKRNMPNIKAVTDFIVSRYSDFDDTTFFDGIHLLGRGSNGFYDLNTNKINIKKYYELKFNKSSSFPKFTDTLKQYSRHFMQSINLRLRSDVKVGSCLSGGMDSSSVCAISSQLLAKKNIKLTAIHAKSTDKLTDESEYAKIVGDHCKLDLQIIEPTAENFINSIDEVAYTQEEPFVSTSIYMQYFVMQKAKELGCKVMLDGQGGDETLLGYERYYPAAYLDIYRKSGFFQALKATYSSSKNNKKMSLIWIIKYFTASVFPKLRKMYLM